MDFALILKKMIEDGTMPYSIMAQDNTAELVKWIALRESDKTRLRQLHPGGWDQHRVYKVDSLGERIAVAFADFLFSDDPTVTAANEANQELLKELMLSNDLASSDYDDMPSEFHRAADMVVSEGEAWWRWYVDRDQSDRPILDWNSRAVVVPLLRGRKLLAVAFVDELKDDDRGTWHRVEYHGEGVVINSLYLKRKDPEGDRSKMHDALAGIGVEEDLDRRPETEGLEPIWEHGLPMLAGRVVNRFSRSYEVGVSEYRGIEDQLWDLNETWAIDGENFRMAGKKRAVMPRKYAKSGGLVDGTMDVFFADESEEDEMGDGGSGVFKILEYQYDGTSSIARKDDLTSTALTRVGLARQLVDANATEGFAQSGTALRTRLMPTVVAAKGKARSWRGAPGIIALGQQVDALPVEDGGFGRPWVEPSQLPGFELAAPLPADETEIADLNISLVQAELRSMETAIAQINPTWSATDVMTEARRIVANREGSLLEPSQEEL